MRAGQVSRARAGERRQELSTGQPATSVHGAGIKCAGGGRWARNTRAAAIERVCSRYRGRGRKHGRRGMSARAMHMRGSSTERAGGG
jgi:hypothetical protein